MSDFHCKNCGDLVDDDPEEFMVDGRCLDCNKAYMRGVADERKAILQSFTGVTIGAPHKTALRHRRGGFYKAVRIVEERNKQ